MIPAFLCLVSYFPSEVIQLNCNTTPPPCTSYNKSAEIQSTTRSVCPNQRGIPEILANNINWFQITDLMIGRKIQSYPIKISKPLPDI